MIKPASSLVLASIALALAARAAPVDDCGSGASTEATAYKPDSPYTLPSSPGTETLQIAREVPDAVPDAVAETVADTVTQPPPEETQTVPAQATTTDAVLNAAGVPSPVVETATRAPTTTAAAPPPAETPTSLAADAATQPPSAEMQAVPAETAATNTSNPSGTCPDGAFFCEDFEAYGVGKDAAGAPWVFDGAAALTDEGARGSRSLYLTPGGAPDRGGILMEGFSVPGPENFFYGRLYAQVEQFATGPKHAHFTIAEFAGKAGEERVRPLGGQWIEGTSLWGVGSDGGPSGDWVAWQKSVPTADKVWMCLEWRMDAVGNAIDVWIDGEAKTDLSVSQNDHGGAGEFIFPQPFTKMWVGWWLYQANTTPEKFDVLIDDIVLSKTKVGC